MSALDELRIIAFLKSLNKVIGADCLCWEQGFACVPAGNPCNVLSQPECVGECYWVTQSSTVCFEGCCMEETWGYCDGPRVLADCGPQQVTGFCSDPCVNVAGAYWDGAFCLPIVCCCEGPDCGETYATPAECLAARADCALDACAMMGGYCDPGDYVEPTCSAGYGGAWGDVGGACGLGKCCAPCPDEDDPDVTYVAHDPGTCAVIDYFCDQGWPYWGNECGCGCRLP